MFVVVLLEIKNPIQNNEHKSIFSLGKLAYLRNSAERFGAKAHLPVLCNGLLWRIDGQPFINSRLWGYFCQWAATKRARRANPWLHIQDCIWRRQAHGLLTEVWFCARIIQGCSNSFLQKMFRIWAHQMLRSWAQHGSESKITGPTVGKSCAAWLLSRLSLCLPSKSTAWGQAELGSCMQRMWGFN